MAFFLYVGKWLHTFCTPFAHFPNSGSFCARCAQPAFLCIKRRKVRRTRLSSTLCVPLHPSAGWLQGSPYRRFLLPPAFRFAGAGVLPGSGLGCRSSLRSSLPVPAGACPACERRCPSGQMRWHDLYSPRLDKMSSHGNNGLPFSLHGVPAPSRRRFPALLLRIIAGYPMQTVMRFSKCEAGTATKKVATKQTGHAFAFSEGLASRLCSDLKSQKGELPSPAGTERISKNM